MGGIGSKVHFVVNEFKQGLVLLSSLEASESAAKVERLRETSSLRVQAIMHLVVDTLVVGGLVA